jgi:hypothetical protein
MARSYEVETEVDLTFIGIDPDTKEDSCPAAWVDYQAMDFVLQGYKADEATQSETRKKSPLPDHEAVIRIPARLLPIIRAACDEMERALNAQGEVPAHEAVR